MHIISRKLDAYCFDIFCAYTIVDAYLSISYFATGIIRYRGRQRRFRIRVTQKPSWKNRTLQSVWFGVCLATSSSRVLSLLHRLGLQRHTRKFVLCVSHVRTPVLCQHTIVIFRADIQLADIIHRFKIPAQCSFYYFDVTETSGVYKLFSQVFCSHIHAYPITAMLRVLHVSLLMARLCLPPSTAMLCRRLGGGSQARPRRVAAREHHVVALGEAPLWSHLQAASVWELPALESFHAVEKQCQRTKIWHQ